MPCPNPSPFVCSPCDDVLDRAERPLRAALGLPPTGRVRGAKVEFFTAAKYLLEEGVKHCGSSCPKEGGAPSAPNNLVDLQRYRNAADDSLGFEYYDWPATGRRLGTILVVSRSVLKRIAEHVAPATLGPDATYVASYLIEAALEKEMGSLDDPGGLAYHARLAGALPDGPVHFQFDRPLGDCSVEYLDLWGRGIAIFIRTAEEDERWPAAVANMRSFVLGAAALVLRIDYTKRWRGYWAVRDGPNKLPRCAARRRS